VDLQTSLDDLVARLRGLAGKVNDLRLTAVEDRPAHAEQLILDTVSDAVEDLTGWIFEALGEASAAKSALGPGHDTGGALRKLGSCHERMNRLSATACTGLLSYDTHAELSRLARERGHDWPGWLAMLRLGVESCNSPLAGVHTALLVCWQQAAGLCAATSAISGGISDD
jgi:hypothetical protein